MRTDMRAELDALLAEYEAMSARLTRITSEISGTTGSAKSSDGTVSVTVGAGGALARLAIDPTLADGLDLNALAARIVEAVGRASARRNEQVRASIHDAMPERWQGLVGPEGSVDLSRPQGGS